MRLTCLVICLAFLVSACSSDGSGRHGIVAQETKSAGVLLLRYDANADKVVSRSEMEVGLKADFTRDDTDHNGVLDSQEVASVNHARWSTDASATSPIVDWDDNGFADLREYGATIHSLFDRLDENGDGIVDQQELAPDRDRRPDNGR